MDLTWLADFAALAETGNFSRAAARRHVTQPAFSRRIRALEEWAGAELFRRGAQPVTLSEAGARIAPLLAEIGRRLEEAREAAGEAGRGGGLRFAATHALSFSFFPRWLADRAPSGPVHLVSDTLEACEALMQSGRAQFLLCHGHPDVPGALRAPAFAIRQVGRDRLRLVAAPGREDAPLLGYGAGSGLGRIVRAAASGPAGGVPTFTSHLAAVLRTMAREGRGTAWLPDSLAEPDLAAGALVRAAAPETDIACAILLIRPEAPLPPAAEAFWTSIPAA